MNTEQIIERFKENQLAHKMGLNAANFMIVKNCLKQWQQPHRYYHGLGHLSDLLRCISDIPLEEMEIMGLGLHEREILEIVALFHDVVYDPRKKNNEEQSIKFVKSFGTVLDRSCPEVETIFDIIKDTKYNGNKCCSRLSEMFCSGLLDLHSLICNLPSEIIKNEINLLKEYQWCDFLTYKNKRLEFLNNFSYCQSSQELKDFVSSYRPKIGVYAGSFNPFHCGHMNILEQSEKIFDKIIIATGVNPSKSQEKVGWSVRDVLPFHEVVEYNTLLPEYLKTLDYADVTLIRGLRNGYDLQYEMNQLRFLEDYQCRIPVAYFICEKEFMHISSSDIRGLAKFEYNDIGRYKPKKYQYSTDATSNL